MQINMPLPYSGRLWISVDLGLIGTLKPARVKLLNVAYVELNVVRQVCVKIKERKRKSNWLLRVVILWFLLVQEGVCIYLPKQYIDRNIFFVYKIAIKSMLLFQFNFFLISYDFLNIFFFFNVLEKTNRKIAFLHLIFIAKNSLAFSPLEILFLRQQSHLNFWG